MFLKITRVKEQQTFEVWYISVLGENFIQDLFKVLWNRWNELTGIIIWVLTGFYPLTYLLQIYKVTIREKHRNSRLFNLVALTFQKNFVYALNFVVVAAITVILNLLLMRLVVVVFFQILTNRLTFRAIDLLRKNKFFDGFLTQKFLL